KLTLEPANTDMAFMLCDTIGLLYKNDDLDYRGFADSNAPAETKRLRDIFDYLWQYAETEPRLQQLHISPPSVPHTHPRPRLCPEIRQPNPHPILRKKCNFLLPTGFFSYIYSPTPYTGLF